MPKVCLRTDHGGRSDRQRFSPSERRRYGILRNEDINVAVCPIDERPTTSESHLRVHRKKLESRQQRSLLIRFSVQTFPDHPVQISVGVQHYQFIATLACNDVDLVQGKMTENQ